MSALDHGAVMAYKSGIFLICARPIKFVAGFCVRAA